MATKIKHYLEGLLLTHFLSIFFWFLTSHPPLPTHISSALIQTLSEPHKLSQGVHIEQALKNNAVYVFCCTLVITSYLTDNKCRCFKSCMASNDKNICA